jgi:hypothetical protein
MCLLTGAQALARLEITHGLRLAQGSRVIITTNRTDQPFPVAVLSLSLLSPSSLSLSLSVYE